ncbi:MAG: electron transport complex subunit RsxC [Clostridia bacterium]
MFSRPRERRCFILPIKHSFRGGVHPLKHEGKQQTREKQTVDFVSDSVTIPMAMHLGAPSTPCVKKGDHVLMGQIIGDPVGFLGLPVHSGISGIVTAVEKRQQMGGAPVDCVCIENDFKDEWIVLFPLGNVETVEKSLIIPAIKNAGICGMGGATFPTYVKLNIPEGKTCDTIIVNGAECETHLTSDYRLMLEDTILVIDGLRAVMRALDVKRGIIAIEDNKPSVIKLMQSAIAGRNGVELMTMRTKYPQGSEKQLIKAATGREVPQKKLPIDVSTIMLNAATAAAIATAIIEGKPLISRITTVTGHVKEPKNLRLRIGTEISDIIGFCGGFDGEIGKIVMGGAMTGLCAPDDKISITKGSGGILVLNQKEAREKDEDPCIRCGRCVSVCPMGLNPYLLKHYCDIGDLKSAEKLNVLDCMLCGCCSFACPSKRFLTASFKHAKDKIAYLARKEQK